MGAAGTAPVARMVLAADLRQRWRGLVLLGVLATLWASVTMSAVAGARRTASVIDRFQRETLAYDASFSVPDDFDGQDLYRALLARPEVLTADLTWTAGTGLAFDRTPSVFVNIAAGVTGVWGRDIDRPIVLRGRTADPSNADEVMVTSATADLLNIEPGDHLDIPTWDRKELEAWQKVRGAYPPFNGPLVHVVVVGVVRITWDLQAMHESELFVLTTPAFVARWSSAIGPNSRSVVVAFRDPDHLDPATLVGPLTASLGKTVTLSSANDAYASHARDAAGALTVGLLVLAVAAGLTGALLVGFAVAREMRRSADRYQSLGALGATPRLRAVALSAPIAVVAVATASVSVVAAVAASTFFPVGSARAAEPNRGIWLDLPILAAGAPVVVFVMLAVAMFTSLRSVGARFVDQKRTRFTAVLGRAGPAAMVGQMNALGSRERRSTLVAAAMTFLGLTSTAWFAHSLHDLERSPQRWGYTWSSSPDLGFAADKQDAAIASTLADPDVAGAGVINVQTAIVGGRPVEISAYDGIGGVSVRPHVLSGRLPTSSREIALGRRTARALGVGIGDTVWIDSVAFGSSAWNVVGLIVPPALPGTPNPGDGAFTLPVSHAELFSDAVVASYLAISYRPGADVRSLEDRLTVDPGWRFGTRSHATQPGAIADFTGVAVLLPWLAGFFVALGFGATMLAAVRRGTPRGRDVRVLRALGFTPRDIRRCSLAEALTIATVGLLAGVPAGLLIGRQAWRLTTDDLGVVATQPSPALVVLGAVGVAFLVSIVASSLGARRALILAADAQLLEE